MTFRLLLAWQLFILFASTLSAQYNIDRSGSLNIALSEPQKTKVLAALDSLFAEINKGKIDSNLINPSNYALNRSILSSLKGYENKDTLKRFYKRQIINIYPTSKNSYFVTIAYLGCNGTSAPELKLIFNLCAENKNGTICFSTPLKHYTYYWNIKKLKNTTYYFCDNINIERAIAFDKKNSIIAQKLGLKPEKFNFYLCNNYQEALHLMGYEYDQDSNGQTRSGYGVDGNTIFSVMHNEDFSHDILHYYSEKIRINKKRNHMAEEGLAYLWGNAYYTKANGEMVDQKELIGSLKNYLKENPNADLLVLFSKNQKLFGKLAAEISAGSVLSGLICEKIEKTKGSEGIKKLLNSGSGEDNYFKSVEELVGINKRNFNEEVLKLINSSH